MRVVKRAALITLGLTMLLWAIDYSERSTQELIASLHPGGKNIPVILHELKKRVPTMTQKEKIAYEKKLKELENAKK